MAMRGSTLRRVKTFARDLAALENKFPGITEEVAEVEDILRLGYHVLPQSAVGGQYPGVAVHVVNYSPNGALGLRMFQVTYHATQPDGLGRRTIKMLTIVRNPK